MRRPTKALILAAGLGTRMRPLSKATPKPLLPVWNTPVIDYAVSLLASWGVKELLVNLHHGAHAILQHFLHAAPPGVTTNFSYEPDILGTGGALVRGSWFLDSSPFWLLNSDVIADVDPRPLLSLFRREDPLSVLWLIGSDGPRTVEVCDGRIRTFRSANAGGRDTLTFSGLHLLSPRILRYLPQSGFGSVIDAYESAMGCGEKILGHTTTHALWADIGTPESYLDAHSAIRRHGLRRCASPGKLPALLRRGHVAGARRRGARISGFLSIADDVSIAPGAGLADSVLHKGVRIGPRATVHRAVVASGAGVRGSASRLAMTAASTADESLLRALLALRWSPERTLAVFMAPRGSARSFTRVRLRNQSAVVIKYSPDRWENTLYAPDAGFLRDIGIPVPAILVDLPEHATTVVQDLGDTSLLDRTRAAQIGPMLRHYRRVLDMAARMHHLGKEEAARRRLRLPEPFGPALYRWEHDLFCQYMAARNYALAEGALLKARRELRRVARALQRETMVLIHRDLQSSNVLLYRERPFLIDFQGMRLGPAMYDVASLLCDPYVSLPPDTQLALLDYYTSSLGQRPPDAHAFWLAAVQRLVQALGAYDRLARQPGTTRFQAHIVPGLLMLRHALRRAEGLPALTTLVEHALMKEDAP